MYSISNKLEYLSNFGVQESYKGKRSEWLRYKDISDLAKLGKIFTQIIRSHVFSTSTNKHFTWNLWIISFLQWTWYMISKQKIYIIHVIQLSSIYYYSMLPNCNSPIFIIIIRKDEINCGLKKDLQTTFLSSQKGFLFTLKYKCKAFLKKDDKMRSQF